MADTVGYLLKDDDLRDLSKAYYDYEMIDSALDWYKTRQGGDFWADYYDGDNLEEGRAVIIATLRHQGRQDLLPEEFREVVSIKDIEELV